MGSSGGIIRRSLEETAHSSAIRDDLDIWQVILSNDLPED
jgi:hypothetical protein